MSNERPPREQQLPLRRPPWPWLALVGVLVLVGGFAGYGFGWSGETPAEGWEAVTRAAEAGDWGAVRDCFDTDSQNRLAPSSVSTRGLDAGSVAGMSNRERDRELGYALA